MLNEIVGMYLSNEYNITTDRIFFALSIDSSTTSSFSLNDATNGAKLKTDLSTLNYYITKYSIWTQNGILDVEIIPDNEASNKIKTWAFTKLTESPVIPVKPILADLNINIINSQNITDDLFIALDIFKISQDKASDLIDIGRAICLTPDNIDIQTLGIEKYLIYTNELLKALIIASGGNIPNEPDFIDNIPTPRSTPEKTKACRRT